MKMEFKVGDIVIHVPKGEGVKRGDSPRYKIVEINGKKIRLQSEGGDEFFDEPLWEDYNDYVKVG